MPEAPLTVFDGNACLGNLPRPAWEDRLNPVFVKEMRQAVRGPLVLALFFLTLAVMFGLLALVMLKGASQDGFHSPNGLLAFFTLLPSLTVLTMVCMTAWAGTRMALERSLDNEDPLYFTPLPPERIVHGKLFAALALTGIFFSAGAPFLMLTMMMRGVDITAVAFLTVLFYQAIIIMHQTALVLGGLRVRNGVKIVIATAAGVVVAPAMLGWLAWLMYYSFTTAGGSGANLDFLFPVASFFGLLCIKVLNTAVVACIAPNGPRYFLRDEIGSAQDAALNQEPPLTAPA